jgi:two-component system sensor histidine kinase UhpB
LTSLARLPFLWRIFAVNAALLVTAALVLIVTPVTIPASVALIEAIEILTVLAAMLAANVVLLRPVVRPLDRLIDRMRTVDLLRPGQRLVAEGGREIEELVQAFNQMLERLERERQASSRRILDAQEQERTRISHGLHDEVGQALTAVLLQLDAVVTADELERRVVVAEAKEAVREALDDIRRMAQELRPELLEHLGLVTALRELGAKFAARSGVAVDYRFSADLPSLSDDVELTLYRVAQESLTNVARHAGATAVRLALEPGPDSVVLCIADDGHGMPESVSSNGHGGLRGMRERALLVGGVLAIKPGRDGGVEVRLEVPAGDA